MTVQAQVPHITYTANGVTTVFAYPFRILSAAHLKIFFDAVLQPGGYVVSNIGAQGGGNVTFAVAPLNGVILEVRRDVPATQEVDYQPYDAFPAETHEMALDKLTMIAQDLGFGAGSIQRNLRLKNAEPLDPGVDMTLPLGLAARQGGRILGFDPVTGNPIFLPTTTPAYGVQRQLLVSSAGQTVFNTAINYTPGLNAVGVYVNGLRQVTGIDFVETSSGVVTFTYPLQAGDEVEFFAGETSGGISGDAASITFQQAGAGAAVRSAQAKMRETFSLGDFGAVGDGVADDRAALENTEAAAGLEVFEVDTLSYRIAAPSVGPVNLSAKGLGSQNGVPRSALIFTAQPGAAGKQWDFSAVGQHYLNLQNLRVAHSLAKAAINGTGIALKDAPYSYLDRLWVGNFNIGIDSTGMLFYSEFRNLVCMDNFEAGFKHAGNLLNGMSINGGQFSRNGTGFYVENGGSHVNLYGVYREGNQVGMNVQGVHILNDTGGYFEAQTDLDVYLPNIYPFLTAVYNLYGTYFDAASALGLPRVRASLTRINAIGNKFYNDPTVPPFQLDGTEQTKPSVFLNNSYRTEAIANAEAGQFIVDSKHPLFLPSFGAPVDFPVRAGTVFYNTDPATMSSIFGWKARVSGWLSGAPPAIAPTATTFVASKQVDLSSNTGWKIGEGDEIKIAGVTFGPGNDPSAMVVYTEPGPKLFLNKVCNQSLIGAAISYNAVFGNLIQVIPAPTVVAGQGARHFSATNILLNNGGNVHLMDVVIPFSGKLRFHLQGMAGNDSGDNTGTTQDAMFIATNVGGVINISAVTYANVINAAGGAKAWTVLPIDTGGGNSTLRVFATQVTGGDVKFGYSADIVGTTGLYTLSPA